MSKYTAEQVRACILAYKNGDLNYCRSGIVDLLTEYAAILDAEGDSGAVDRHDSDCATHNMPAFPNGECDCSLRGMEPAAWISHRRVVGLPDKDFYGKLPIQSLQPGFYSHTPLYAHPAQSVDVEKVREVIAELRARPFVATFQEIAGKLTAALQEKGNG